MHTAGTPIQTFIPNKGWTDGTYVGRDGADRMRHLVTVEGADMSVRIELLDEPQEVTYKLGDECLAWHGGIWNVSKYLYRGSVRGTHFVEIEGKRCRIMNHAVHEKPFSSADARKYMMNAAKKFHTSEKDLSEYMDLLIAFINAREAGIKWKDVELAVKEAIQ